MNYRHAYHAGNFADVIKHTLLTMLIRSLQQKPSPFCFMDTHAGCGIYDLFATPALKTKEYENGIEKAIHADNPPAAIKDYLRCVHEVNNRLLKAHYAALQYYPGSPMIARQLLRAKDHMVLCELHPEDHQILRNHFLSDHQVSVHHLDGFQGMKAFLPPKERRGLVLIDPPYEDADEFVLIAQSLPIALKRFPQGIYAIWYPIKDRQAIQQFHATLRHHCEQTMLALELTIYPEIESHLNGSGLIILNPPWKFKENVTQVLEWLWNALSINKQGGFSAKTL